MNHFNTKTLAARRKAIKKAKYILGGELASKNWPRVTELMTAIAELNDEVGELVDQALAMENPDQDFMMVLCDEFPDGVVVTKAQASQIKSQSRGYFTEIPVDKNMVAEVRNEIDCAKK